MRTALIASVLATMPLVLAAAPTAVAQQQQAEVTLQVGDNAPLLEHVRWIKGEPVEEYQPDHIYVLDFWATWCPPCVAAIPHINALQQRHKDDNVHVVAVAIWGSQDNEAFVEKRGDRMAYRVAVDVEDKTAAAFMTAAGQGGIPTVMLVDGSGEIAWIGRPDAQLDLAVRLMVAGEFTPERMEEERQAILEQERIRQQRVAELNTIAWDALTQMDWPAVEELFTELFELEPAQTRQAATFVYVAKVAQGKAGEARKYAVDLLSTDLKEDAFFLSNFAWAIVSPDQSVIDREDVDAELAIKAATMAADLTERKVADILDTLARAHYVAGDLTTAISTQEEAVEAASSEDERALMQGRLDGYLQVRDAG